MGLCGKSGEAIDIVKKWLAQGHQLERTHLAEGWEMSPGIWPRPPLPWTCPWKRFSRLTLTRCASAIQRALTAGALKRGWKETC